MTEQWFYTRQGQRVGPVPIEQLRELAAQGQLPAEELVWKEGLPAWLPAHTIPGLWTPQNLVSTLPPARSLDYPSLPVQAGERYPTEELRDEPRRRKRKKKAKATGMSGGLKVGLIVGGSVLGVALLFVLIWFFVVPLADSANWKTYSGSYPVSLHPGEKTTHTAYFKQKHWVTIKVTNNGMPGIFHIGVKDPANQTVFLQGTSFGKDLSVNFEAKQAGDYTFEIQNVGPVGGSAVVAYSVH